MKIAPVADVKARFSSYLEESRKGPVVVTRNGKPVAVVLRVEGADELEDLLLAHSPRLREILDKSRRSIGKSGAIPHEAFWKKVEKHP